MRILLLVTILLISSYANSCTITVRLEQFTSQAVKLNNNQWQGLDIELIAALLDEVNCTFEIIELPWARAIAMLKTGELDMMLNMSKTAEREAQFQFIGPVNEELIVLATLRDKPVVMNSFKDILKLEKPIALQRGAYYGQEIADLLAQEKYKDKFIQVIGNKTKIELLKMGRISGFFEAKQNILFSVKSDEDFKNVWYHPFVIHHNYVYYAFSKTSVSGELLEKLRLAHKRLIAKKTLSKIHQIYQ